MMFPMTFSLRRRAIAAALALAFAAAANAAPPATPASMASAAAASLPEPAALPVPTLPAAARIAQVLDAAPSLREAQSLSQSAAHGAQALRYGSNEVSAQAQLQQRRVESAPDSGRYAEWQLALNRQLRLPSQALADNGMADAMTVSAQAGAAVARQALLVDALSAWFAAQRAQAAAALAADDVALIGRQLHAVQRRQALGDASVLEVEQLQAEEARSRSTLVMAQGLAESSRSALSARYPALTQAAPPSAPGLDGAVEPTLPGESPEALLADMLEHDAVLARSRAALRQAQAMAAQAKAARSPQPTVGVYMGSERGGNERIVGLQFALPFGGPARVEQERAALAEADAARWRLNDAELRARADFERLLATARAQAGGAQAMAAAAQAQARAAERMLRAYQLGEAALSDWLVTRRSALDALRQAQQSRFDAAQSAVLIGLQAGLLFPPAGGGNG